MELLNKYFKIQQDIFDYFEYKETWQVFPLSDDTDYYWAVKSETVFFCKANSKEQAVKIMNEELDGDNYSNEIRNNTIYRGFDYTMICVDTYTDNNSFLSIFDNAKQIDPNLLLND